MTDAPARHRPAHVVRHALIAALFGGAIAVCYFFLDRPAVIWARGLDPLIIDAFKKVTVLGNSTPYLVALTVLYAAQRFSLKRPVAATRALFAIAAVAVSGLTVDLIKPIVARWRPKAFFADPAQYGFAFFKTGYNHYSFPSGHATTAWAVACVLVVLFPRWRVLWIVVAAVVASSRVIVGAHYPGDVLAGAWFGVVVTLALSRTAWFCGALAAPGGRDPGR